MTLGFLRKIQPRREGWQVGASLAFIAIGFALIGLAWNGAASLDFAQGQIPYLLSGGAAGLGLIAVGVTLLLFEAARRSRVHLDQRLDLLVQALEETRAAPAAHPNGHRATEGLVVVGRSSYHLPDCRLVTGKQDQLVLTADEAAQRGLAPCRVCAPDAVTG